MLWSLRRSYVSSPWIRAVGKALDEPRPQHLGCYRGEDILLNTLWVVLVSMLNNPEGGFYPYFHSLDEKKNRLNWETQELKTTFYRDRNYLLSGEHHAMWQQKWIPSSVSLPPCSQPVSNTCSTPVDNVGRGRSGSLGPTPLGELNIVQLAVLSGEKAKWSHR